jgi:mannose-6-phosphate isomerase-like protein (cupin superfamily)
MSEGAGEDRVPVSNPVTGVSLYDVPGEEGVAEIRLAPGAQGPAEHVHRTTEERFEVREGTVTFRVEGRERRLGPGTEVRVSSGTPHAFRNEGREPAAMRVRTVPPNDRLGEVVATLFGLAHDGKVDDRGRPGLLRAMVMAQETLDETYFAGVPYAVQRVLGETFGPIGRALGHRAVEERYLDESFWRARAAERDGDERESDAAAGTDRGTGNAGAGPEADTEADADAAPDATVATGSPGASGGIEIPVEEAPASRTERDDD